MQGLAFPRGKGRTTPTLLALLLLAATLPTLANGSCRFPDSWAGAWYQHGEEPVTVINATHLGDKICLERKDDKYIVHAGNGSESCYQGFVIFGRHENVIQYRQALCMPQRVSMEDMDEMIRTDEPLFSMFRLNAKPIPCPFSGSPFTFSYNNGHGECSSPASLAERCTDESKLLLKFQACPDLVQSESTTEELQCLATWKDGSNKYLLGVLKGRADIDEKTYRCILYEERAHHGKQQYLLAQSGDATCSALNNVYEGSPSIKLTKVDKERCKYPSWVTQHHHWHSLDGTKIYHFTNKNATLKVKSQEPESEAYDEEKIVCHNLEKLYPNDNMQGHKVKLIAHVTRGCDIGYVCMIFHKRDDHVIELQQSSHKSVIPDDACSIADPSVSTPITLITPNLHKRKCPQLGRYLILNFAPGRLLTSMPRRQRRSEKLSRTAKRRTWQDDTEDNECRSTDVQIGCNLPEQTEMLIGNTCDTEQVAYTCHGSWKEKDTWYTIVSHRDGSSSGQAQCFSMNLGWSPDKSDRNGRKLQEQELYLTRPTHTCYSNIADQWTYRLSNQGVCEDLTKAASSTGNFLSLSKILLTLSVVVVVLSVLLSR
ncbi:uncharacterized protein [Prorops nasuta]|uniref:uncharacterized protein n=1 Tax=Prorops nasuta TaxID=863751 RepID=UPI0034CF2B4B